MTSGGGRQGGLARLAYDMWRRESSRTLGLSPRTFTGFGAVMVAAAVVLAGSAAAALREVSGVSATMVPDVTPVIRVLGQASALTGALIGIVFSLLNADSSRLETLLRLVGASNHQRLALLFAPLATVTVAMSLLLAAPLVIFGLNLSDGVAAGAVVSVVLVLVACLCSLVGLAAHQALSRQFRRRIRLTVVHANATAAFLLTAGAVAACRPAFDPSIPARGWRRLMPGEAVAFSSRAVESHRGLLAVLASLFLLAAAALLLVAVCGRESPEPRTGRLWASRHVPAPGSPFWATVWFEVLTIGRSPATIVSFIGAVAASIAAVFLRHSSVADVVLLMGPAVAGATAMRATGVNLPSAWVIWTLRGKGRTWSAAKVVGAAVVAVGTLSVCLPFLVGAGGLKGALAVTAQVFVPAFVGSLAAGALAPVSDDQPLSSAVAGALTLIVTGGLSILAGRGLSALGTDDATLTLAVVVVAALGLVAAAHHRLRPEAVVSPS